MTRRPPEIFSGPSSGASGERRLLVHRRPSWFSPSSTCRRVECGLGLDRWSGGRSPPRLSPGVLGVGLEQPVLVRGGWTTWSRPVCPPCRGLFEPAHVALELGAGEPAAAADVYRVEVAGLDERIHGGASDAQQLGGLLWCQQ